MALQNLQLSYAAGSTSLDPYGFRVIDTSATQRVEQLMIKFPVLSNFFNANSLIVSAYPAALGLSGIAPFVDTYLHPATFIRAIRLATAEQRTVVMVAQPLVGADLLLQLCHQELKLPSKMLWAVGGYYFPVSLERFVRELLADRGCDVTFLHSYGVAEIGHTCFAAMERSSSGTPRFKQIATEVTIQIDDASAQLSLNLNNRCIQTGDRAERVGNEWSIQSGRIDKTVLQELESWGTPEWKRRTGYLRASDDSVKLQLREGLPEPDDSDEIHYHKFWHHYGGSLTSKPCWNLSE